MSLVFKQRPCTNNIYLVSKDLNNRTYRQIYMKCRQEGEFDTGYHYFIDRLGRLTADRDEKAVAGWDLLHSTESLYILIDAPKGKITDAQNFELNQLLKELQERYPEAVVQEK